MKTGTPPRLADKLNADLTSLRQEHLDLINSQLTSFRRDLSSTVSDAQHTITSDIQQFQMRMRTTALQNSIAAEQMFRISPKTVTICVLATILTLMAATVLWQWAMTSMALTSRMQRLGLQAVTTEGTTWLILNNDRTSLRSCTIAGQPVTCIKVED